MAEVKEETTLVVRSPEQLQPKTESQPSKMTRLATFTPTNLTEAMQLAKFIANSDLAPKEYKGKPGNVLIAMQMGAEVGLAPMASIQNIAVINGRPSLWGDSMLAIVQAHPDYEWHREYFEGKDEDYTAVFEIKRKGSPVHVSRYSVKDARVAKLWGKRGYNNQDTPWVTSPKRMLQMRSRGFGCRDQFADALRGLSLAEEAMDLPPIAPAKQTGEVPADLGIATITQSSEPNRGHGNEGMQQTGEPPAPPSKQEVAGETKKQEDWICSECGEKNCHTKDCSHAAAWLASLKKGSGAPSKPETTQTPTQASEASQKSFQRVACVLRGVTTRKVKPLRLVQVTTNDGDWEMSVWPEHLHPILDGIKEKANCIFEVSFKEKNGRKYTNLEHICEIDGQQYQDDKPVEVVQGELTGEQIGFPKEAIDEVEIPE